MCLNSQRGESVEHCFVLQHSHICDGTEQALMIGGVLSKLPQVLFTEELPEEGSLQAVVRSNSWRSVASRENQRAVPLLQGGELVIYVFFAQLAQHQCVEKDLTYRI